MSLTEMPAVAFASLAIAAAAWAMSAADTQRSQTWLGFALGGLCFGVAILGRQLYLPAAGGFALIALFEPRFRWPAALAMALSIAVPSPIFLLWGGIVAPHLGSVGNISLGHGALAFAYLSALILILAPGYYLSKWKWSLVAGLFVGLALLPFGGMPAPVAPGVTQHLPPLLARFFQCTTSVVMVGGGAAVIVASAVNIWERRDDRIFVLMVLLTLGMTFTAAGIVHIFSSRYLMTTFPFALIAVQPFVTPSSWAAARLAGGGLLGYLSLSNYLA